MSVKGTPRLQELAITSFEVSYEKATIGLKATAAFVDASTGVTLAWTRGEGGVWSKKTMEMLGELRLAMELDLGKRHFIEGNVASNGKELGLDLEGGLGGHLGVEVGADAPSV